MKFGLSSQNYGRNNYNSSSIIQQSPTKNICHQSFQNLKIFQDDQLINLETSIPLLRVAGILKLTQSIEQTKLKLEEEQNPQLINQVKFLYYLWQLVNEEEINSKQLKQIIKLILTHQPKWLRNILIEAYGNQGKVQDFLGACNLVIFNTTNYLLQENQQNILFKNSKSVIQNSSAYQHIQIKNRSSIYNKSSDKREIMGDSSSDFMNHDLNYTLQLSVDQEKSLVSRLYRIDKYQQREEQKKSINKKRQIQELKQCTFKPNMSKRSNSVQKPKEINGYNKAIDRLRTGNQKSKISKQLRDYKPIGQNYEKLKQKGINPPKFLNRKKKQEDKVLFIISFDLGRYKTNVKIRQGDTEQSIAQRLCKIYSLKQEFYNQICEVVRSQLEAYYQELYQLQIGMAPPFSEHD